MSIKTILIKTILEDARNLIRQGWIQGDEKEPKAGDNMGYNYCSIGALKEITFGEELNKTCEYLVKFYPKYAIEKEWAEDENGQDIKIINVVGTIIHFNDNDNTTRGKVLRIFTRSINSLTKKKKQIPKEIKKLVPMPVIKAREKVLG